MSDAKQQLYFNQFHAVMDAVEQLNV